MEPYVSWLYLGLPIYDNEDQPVTAIHIVFAERTPIPSCVGTEKDKKCAALDSCLRNNKQPCVALVLYDCGYSGPFRIPSK